MNGPPPRRGIRSFVLRAGRITPAQKRALEELMPRYGLPFAGAPIDLDAAFGRRAPRVLEIGFGNGDTLIELAARAPWRDFIGAEVHAPGVGHCLLAADAAGLSNLRVVMHDAVELLRDGIAPGSLDEVLLLFPDDAGARAHLLEVDSELLRRRVEQETAEIRAEMDEARAAGQL
ncbi:MAG TPA: hypothetical protein VFM30_11800, partial [Steroidobacteraceae bacterium]|nr:hypothetical protein [Steroidobacteraceae bacterium]